MTSLFFYNENPARAEYRVYKLGIKYDEKQKKEIEVLTTLDDQQYVTYYRQTASQQTRLLDHWMCRGRTDAFKKYCAAPIKPKSLQTPASFAKTESLPAQGPPPSQAPRAPVPVVLQ